MRSPIKDQGECGSCWAFSTTEGVESKKKLRTEQLVDCEKKDDGCDGGDIPEAVRYLKKKGMATNAEYPDTSSKRGKTGKCKWDGEYNVTVKSFSYALPQCDRGDCSDMNEHKLAAAVAKHGPLSICINSGDGQPGDWAKYKSGVWYKECKAKANLIDHCVQLVGYNKSGEEPYWKIRNSWGTDWGESGFIRLPFGVKNTCCVGCEAVIIHATTSADDEEVEAMVEEEEAKATPKCEMGPTSLYPPPAEPLPDNTDKVVAWETVNLDDPPHLRWAHIVGPRADGIKKLTDTIVDTLQTLLGKDTVAKLLSTIDKTLPSYYKHLPMPEFGREMSGIANATGIDESVIFIYNIFYSLFGACTSIVAQDDKGELYHARNLDFGLWPALNLTHHNFWALTARLRPLVVNVEMTKGGKALYRQTTFAGFIGAHTAVRPGSGSGSNAGGFTLTIDSRFDNNFDSGILAWLLKDASPTGKDDASEVTMVARKVIEEASDFTSALKTINTTQVLGPAYIIMGGSKPGEGAVITRAPRQTAIPSRTRA